MTTPKAIVVCEFSGTVRNALLAVGFDAYSCDFLPTEGGFEDRHFIGDCRDWLTTGWDLIVGHPPCTRLCNSGVRWLTDPPTKLEAGHYDTWTQLGFAQMTPEQRLTFMWDEMEKGAKLFEDIWNAPCEHICVENPVMHQHAKALIRGYEEPRQIILPHHFGTPEFKQTCLWLRNLPPLVKTHNLTPPKKGTPRWKRWQKVHYATPGEERWKLRSTFFPGVAAAMAMQWGKIFGLPVQPN